MKVIIFLPCLFFFISGFSQNDLQRCSAEKNKTIIKISEDENWQDSVAKRRIEAANEEWRKCMTGKEIPDFEAQTIKGKKVSSVKLKGDVVVLNFWFTTCPPCVAEMPAFNKLVTEYKHKNVKFLGVTFDDKETVKKFLLKRSFNVTIIPGADSLENLFGLLDHPLTLIIDKAGRISKVILGSYIGEQAITEAYANIKPAIDELINQ
jgi:peroxiredoxin